MKVLSGYISGILVYMGIQILWQDYKEMLKTEQHHDHKIVRDEHGVIRWEKNEVVDLLTGKISLNDLCSLLENLGCGKNSEIYRKMYRCMGYSLSGYWEIFYWEVNNEDAEEYKPNAL